ncbi:hypothetical protein Syun_029902 [Stephania yunnanensis]|uniref:PPM-type phosphatase domain-containing protein n=1 Tax=Stephania yunnanensis TaxID=152371 RepID=A0AAP0HGG2_9MAGN
MCATPSSGGVVLASRDGKIVFENTLDARLDVVFHKKLPEGFQGKGAFCGVFDGHGMYGHLVSNIVMKNLSTLITDQKKAFAFEELGEESDGGLVSINEWRRACPNCLFHRGAANDERPLPAVHTRTVVEIRSASFERIPNLFVSLQNDPELWSIFCINSAMTTQSDEAEIIDTNRRN